LIYSSQVGKIVLKYALINETISISFGLTHPNLPERVMNRGDSKGAKTTLPGDLTLLESYFTSLILRGVFCGSI
jgi:hypothetical protein